MAYVSATLPPLPRSVVHYRLPKYSNVLMLRSNSSMYIGFLRHMHESTRQKKLQRRKLPLQISNVQEKKLGMTAQKRPRERELRIRRLVIRRLVQLIEQE